MERSELMKKAILSLVIVFAILLSACSYRYVPSDGRNERRILVPFGKDYFWTDMSRYCIDLDSSMSSMYEMADDCYETVSKLYRFDPVEYEEYVCTKPGLPKEILVYQAKDFPGWFEHPILFVKDGYDLPTFNSTDKIESIYYGSVDECGRSPKKEEYNELDGDVEAFIEELYSYRTEYGVNKSWSNSDIEVEISYIQGYLYYKYKDIDGLMFQLWIFATDDPDMYFTDYTVDGSYYAIVFPKELLKEYFPHIALTDNN